MIIPEKEKETERQGEAERGYGLQVSKTQIRPQSITNYKLQVGTGRSGS